MEQSMSHKVSCMELTWLPSLQYSLHLQCLCIPELIDLLRERKYHLRYYMQYSRFVPDTNISLVTWSKYQISLFQNILWKEIVDDKYISTYRSFVGMYMSSKHDINFVLNKPWLKHYSHCFPFHVMIAVAIIPRWMYQNNQPRSFFSVNSR